MTYLFNCIFSKQTLLNLPKRRIHREHVNMQLVLMYSTEWVFVRHFCDALVYKDIRNLLIKDVIHLVMTTGQNSEYQTRRVLRRCHPKQSSFSCKFGCRSSTKQTTWAFFSNCQEKKLACFYEPQFGRISLNIAHSDFVLKT